jgi:hypothetical protein
MTAKVSAVDLDLATQFVAFRLRSHSFADFMGEHEGGLVLAVQIAGKLQGADAFHRVRKDSDGREQIGETHLARGEDGPARDAVLVIAAGALEFATRGDAIGF